MFQALSFRHRLEEGLWLLHQMVRAGLEIY
jgi:hypothetical protein